MCEGEEYTHLILVTHIRLSHANQRGKHIVTKKNTFYFLLTLIFFGFLSLSWLKIPLSSCIIITNSFFHQLLDHKQKSTPSLTLNKLTHAPNLSYHLFIFVKLWYFFSSNLIHLYQHIMTFPFDQSILSMVHIHQHIMTFDLIIVFFFVLLHFLSTSIIGHLAYGHGHSPS